MRYSVEKLINQIENQERIKYLFFWGHKKTATVSKSCFSQWYEASFSVEGRLYQTAEHWMMAEKARLFGDDEIYRQILKSNNPGHAKALGRRVKNFDQQVWEENRFDIVVKGNYHKFNQNEALKSFLRNTKNRILVEASPVDNIWGIGLAQDHPDIEDPPAWKGLNLLGFALMAVRDLLILNHKLPHAKSANN